MKPSLQRLILLLTVLILCTPLVSATTTCTVLNVTTGPAGPAGSNGTSCTTGVNWTFTLAAGNPATVVNVGSGTAASLDFGIPTGPQGVNGTPGATGSQGPQGVNGTDGAPGPNNDPWYLWINGTRAMTGNLNLGSYKITSLITGTTGDTATNKTYVDTAISGVGAPDLTPFLFINGTRAMTGNLSIGSKYINSLITGTQASDAVNRSYVDAGTYDNDTMYLFINGTRAMTGNLSMGSKYINSVITGGMGSDATNKTYVDTAISGVGAPDLTPFLFINGTRAMTGNLNASGNQIIKLITGGTGDTATNKTYVDTAISGIGSPDLTQFLFINGTRAMTGNLSMGSKYINLIITGGLGSDAVNKTYVDTAISGVGTPDLTQFLFINGTRAMTGNLSMGSNYITGLLSGSSGGSVVNKTYVDAKSPNPQFGYITLMAGSGMVTTTNPGTMNQWETATNKNNFIYWNFTDQGTETVQWIVDFPGDWNSSANVIFTPLWTAQDGSGTVNFTVSAKLFPNDAAIDTALASVGSSVDTLITVGDMHVSPDTTGAAITSVSSGGNTAIIKVARDSATDTLSGTAQLLGLRVKFSTIKVAA